MNISIVKIFGVVLGLGILGACANDSTDVTQTQVDSQGAEGDSIAVSFKSGTQVATLLELPTDVVGVDNVSSIDSSEIENHYIVIQKQLKQSRHCGRGIMTVTLFRWVDDKPDQVEELSAQGVCSRMSVGLRNLVDGEQYVLAMTISGASGQSHYSGISDLFETRKGKLAQVNLLMTRGRHDSKKLDAIVRVRFAK